MRALVVVVVIAGCGGNKDAPVETHAAVDTKPVPADAAPAPAPLVMVTDDGSFPFTLGIAFEGKYPQLPAVNPDGTLIAVFDSTASGPMPIPPISLVVESFGGEHVPDKIAIIDEPSADAASQIEDWAKQPSAAPMIKSMRERAGKAMALLTKYQFGSLIPVEFPIESSGAKKPANIGDLVLASSDSTSESEAMSVTLTDAKGAVVASDVVAPYAQGTYNIGEPETHTCWYRPMLSTAFTDASKRHLYLDIGFRWHEECGPPVSTRWIVWDLAAARAVPAARAAVESVVAAELVARTKAGFVASPHGVGAITGETRRVTLSRDGNSAWVSAPSKDWRASFVVVKAPSWRVDSAMWSQGVADSIVNAKAKAKTLPALDAVTGDPADTGLRAAFVAMTKEGLDDVAAVRPDLVGIGSAPGEQTTTGDLLARGWNAAWKGHVTITSIVAHLAPSKTTGSVVATVSLAKPGGYAIPFMLFCVFDQQSDGTWSLVHIHFAV